MQKRIFKATLKIFFVLVVSYLVLASFIGFITIKLNKQLLLTKMKSTIDQQANVIKSDLRHVVSDLMVLASSPGLKHFFDNKMDTSSLLPQGFLSFSRYKKVYDHILASFFYQMYLRKIYEEVLKRFAVSQPSTKSIQIFPTLRPKVFKIRTSFVDNDISG